MLSIPAAKTRAGHLGGPTARASHRNARGRCGLRGRGTRQLTRTPLPQANAHAMIRRRAVAGGIATKIGNHSFRAAGITAYLKNGGTLEKAAAMANHASTGETKVKHLAKAFRDVPGGVSGRRFCPP